MLKMDP
jgi:predicted DNA-binding ribbon-helix-helix protein